VYLHYVFDLWADWWRKRHARGDVIIVRFADLCRPRHKSAYAEVRVMPTWLLEGLPGGQVAAVGAA
jgi:hypothetical protein